MGKDENITTSENDKVKKGPDFIRQIINSDLESGKNGKRVHTRFPPEPNGYLHIGHAKSICLNFGIAEDYEGGLYNLRFDDTNPEKEDTEYVEAIKEDIKWLGFDWKDRLYFASDYFDKFYEYALELVKGGKAYVDSLCAEEIREYRGTPTKPGKNSPYRDRSIEENLEMLDNMKNGKYKDGEHILRAKIDMAHVNMNMRDPAIYRIKNAPHHNTGDKWHIYPMYDFAHGYEDAIEGITHSICTLEFENHRPLYDWFLDNVSAPCHPQQIEFARLNLSHTIMSKRSLLELVKSGLVDGWDDPRMPTISGYRRRGVTPTAIRTFCKEIGISKVNSLIDMNFFYYIIREEMNDSADRVMAVLDPLKVVITNYEDGKTEEFDADNNPQIEDSVTRKIPFSRELYIERDDFMEDAPKKFFRLAPGREVRLKHSYFLTCNDVIKDAAGNIIELHCTIDPETRGGNAPDGRKVKGTIHWVSAAHAIDAEVRLYDNLFTLEDMADMEEGKDYNDYLNPQSQTILQNCKVEPSLANALPGHPYQFLRKGYFSADSKYHTAEKPVFNRVVALKDSWAKIQKK
ncbi:MAG: glutamine--tRNA ligase/YqeY domain fusion protein [Spirochaetaceae bacterium]|nr:glutamine--tRNA ligase/YqeY domain fusion protein [Spirochaetaceae bacterium]